VGTQGFQESGQPAAFLFGVLACAESTAFARSVRSSLVVDRGRREVADTSLRLVQRVQDARLH
jgi:hypothetical protein